jgi:hypothetical protein
MNDDHLTLKPQSRTPEVSGAERRGRAMETTETLVKTMESILEEREASQAKEKEAVESLNTVLQRRDIRSCRFTRTPGDAKSAAGRLTRVIPQLRRTLKETRPPGDEADRQRSRPPMGSWRRRT